MPVEIMVPVKLNKRSPNLVIDEKLCKKVYSLAKKHATKKHIAASIGISANYWYELEKKYPELLESFTSGREAGVAKASTILDNLLSGKAVEDRVRLDAAKFVLERQGNWVKPPDFAYQVDNSKTIDVKISLVGVRPEVLEAIGGDKGINKLSSFIGEQTRTKEKD